MKPRSFLPAAAVAVVLIFGCAKSGEPQGESPAALLKSLAKAESYETAAACYSAGTRRIASEIVSSANVTEADMEPVLAFLRGARNWDIAEKITGDRAELQIVITDHATDNMVGWSFPLLMKKEQDKWRIDMEKEMTATRDSLKDTKRDYLNRRLKETP